MGGKPSRPEGGQDSKTAGVGGSVLGALPGQPSLLSPVCSDHGTNTTRLLSLVQSTNLTSGRITEADATFGDWKLGGAGAHSCRHS